MAATLHVAVFAAAETATWDPEATNNGRGGWSATGYVSHTTDTAPPTTTTGDDQPGITISGLTAGTAYKLWAVWDDGSNSSSVVSSSTFTTDVSVALTGVSTTVQTGTVTAATTVALTGVSTTAQTGTATPSVSAVSVSLLGVQSQIFVGTLVPATTAVNVALSGITINSYLGNLRIAGIWIPVNDTAANLWIPVNDTAANLWTPVT